VSRSRPRNRNLPAAAARVVDYLARYNRANITLQVRARIIEQLHDGVPKQGSIAGTLNVSLRSLQRRLKAEATSYKALLEDTREQQALDREVAGGIPGHDRPGSEQPGVAQANQRQPPRKPRSPFSGINLLTAGPIADPATTPTSNIPSIGKSSSMPRRT